MKRVTFGWSFFVTVCMVLFMSVPVWGRTIKIGVIGPMNFSPGKVQWNGAVMAAEEINAKGGVQVGKEKMKIELVKSDSNELLSLTDATNAMERLITSDKIDFIVGGYRTEAVLPMQDIAMDNKKIFMSAGAAHPELCLRVAKDYNRYKYFFRVTPTSSNYLVRSTLIHIGFVGAILKKELNIPKVKVAIVAEKAVWAGPIIEAAQGVIPKMGMEVVGIWRPSAVAADVTAELSAIQQSGANLIFTIFASSVGIPFARQAGELKIPAAQVGINTEAQKDGFWEATKGMGNYVYTMNTYARGVEVNELTKPFMDTYIKRFGETPTFTADTYSAILHILTPTIEAVGSLDNDKIVAYMENQESSIPSGKIKYEKDAQGRPTHDLTWGPGYMIALGVQWQDGKLVGVWPNKGVAAPGAPEITYKGMVPYKIPPWMKK